MWKHKDIHIGYDEAGKIPRLTFELCDPFIAVGNTFVTGDVNLECYPEQMPNQRILLSSAESTDTELFDTYKLCAMKMLEGDDDYFVVDLNCEMSLHPTMNGQPYPPLLEQSVIDDAMSKNELFRTVILDGALPRKTLSMGHSYDKRYYLESRKIK